MRPGGFRTEYSFTPKQTLEAGPSMWLDVKVLQPLLNDIGAPLVYPVEAITNNGAVTLNFDQRLFHWYTGYGIWDEKNRVWFNPATWTEWKACQPVTFWVEVGV